MSLIKAVQRAFSKMAPVSLAESWDNTGLLLESPVLRPSANRVLLTIDLTPSVANEALKVNSNVGVIVAYHPAIFRGLKSLSMDDPLHKALLECAAAGISVYSPHTALDSVIGGINDELCEIVSGPRPHQSKVYSVSGALVDKTPDNVLSSVGVGGGRRVELARGEEVELEQLIARIKTGLKLSHGMCASTVRAHSIFTAEDQSFLLGPAPFLLRLVQLAKSSFAPSKIGSVGVCAGSGGSICSALGQSCQAFLTGEMSHHELLSANARGVHVILTAHSNTERFFLASVLKPRLHQLLADEVALMSVDPTPQWEVEVSTEDRDPLVVV